MSQYLFSVFPPTSPGSHPVPPVEDLARVQAQIDAFNEGLMTSGAWVFAGGLHPASTATVVRSSGGQVSITDGPFVESKEHIGGFWVVQAPDLDAALDLATRASAACELPVEVRPFEDLEAQGR